VNVEDAVAALPRCSTCQVPQVGDECLHCRLMDVEAKLARVSFWGTDDWMQKIASLAIVDRPNDHLYPLGFHQDFSDRPGKYTFNVISRPQVVFRPMWLTIAPECARMGTLLDCQVGNRSQTIGWQSGGMPLSVFCPNSWASLDAMREVAGKFKWDTVSVAQDVVLSIDVSIEKYDEAVIEIAHETLYGPRPTAFKAILWGKPIGHEVPLASPIWMAGPHSGSEIESTLKFADIVSKLRGEDPARIITKLARPLQR
jgi:hypothetical protein